jgi:hypothetical protein
MRASSMAFFLLSQLGLTICLGGGPAQAQFRALRGTDTVAMKSNETIELGHVYWVVSCRSLLKSTPEVEVLDGPAEVVATVREAMVLPRGGNCAKKVAGGIVSISSKEISDPSFTHLTLRFLFNTKDGQRRLSHVYNLQLIP